MDAIGELGRRFADTILSLRRCWRIHAVSQVGFPSAGAIGVVRNIQLLVVFLVVVVIMRMAGALELFDFGCWERWDDDKGRDIHGVFVS